MRTKQKQTGQNRQEWHPSKRARNYTIDQTNRYDLKGQLGILIGNSYLECEQGVIEDYNLNATSDKIRIFPCAFFEYGLQGNVENALLLTCALNSGFCDEADAAKQNSPCDIDAYEDPKLKAIIQKIRDGKFDEQPHIALLKEVWNLPNGANYPFVRWWKKIASSKSNRHQWLIDVIKELHGDNQEDDDAFHWLADHLASRDLLYYHTHEGDVLGRWKRSCKKILGKELSPHQEAVIEDIKQAIQLRVPIFISRQIPTWVKYVKDLEEYDLLFCGSSSGGVYISSNNLLLYKDKVINNRSAKAKSNAWEKLKDALKKRYKKLCSR